MSARNQMVQMVAQVTAGRKQIGADMGVSPKTIPNPAHRDLAVDVCALAIEEMGGQRSVDMAGNDWQRLAEQYAEENDALRARCFKLDEAIGSLREKVKALAIGSLREKVKALEVASANRREDQERAERVEAELEAVKTEAAQARKRLAEAIAARSKAEAKVASMTAAPASGNSAGAALFSLLDQGVMTSDEVVSKLRKVVCRE